MQEQPIKILVVDDSFFMRTIISRILSEVPGFTVIGTASDGLDFLKKMETLSPDVVTLDIEMPKMDGLTALKKLMSTKPTPVVILSALATQGAEPTLRALRYGAVDFVLKPSGTISMDMATVRDDLAAKVRVAAGASLAPLRQDALQQEVFATAASRPARKTGPLRDANRVVLIGSSTGGPQALMNVVPKIPNSLNAACLIVQHMPGGFTKSLADRLNQHSFLEVREAMDGDEIMEGVALVAPGDQHMVVAEANGKQVVRINSEPRVWGVRPSVDITINSAAPVFGRRLVGVILTGMGCDGAKGISLIRKSGGHTIAQDEASSVVYGMPRAAAETGCVDRVLPLSKIADGITEMLQF